MFWFSVVVVCPLWGAICAQLFLQTLLCLSNLGADLAGLARRRVDRMDNALAIGVHGGAALLFATLLFGGTWIVVRILHAMQSPLELATFSLVAGASSLWMLPQLPAKLRQGWTLANEPSSLAEHVAGERRAALIRQGVFDLDDLVHITTIDSIRDEYSQLLASNSGPYAGCIFKPASLLPYPRAGIAGALNALLDYAESRKNSPYLDQELRSAAAVDTLRTCLRLLDDFLDISSEDLPTDPHDNARVGFALRALDVSASRANPQN